MTVRGETLKPRLSVEQAYAARDTLARDIYENLFLYIVKKINLKRGILYQYSKWNWK